MDLHIYLPSGKSSFLFYIVAFIFLFVGIPFLSSVYSLLLWYIPFIYIHFIFTGGYGAILAWVLNRILKIGKVRNKKVANYFAFFTGIFAVYFIWTSYITLLFNAGESVSIDIKQLSMAKTFFNVRDFMGISLTPRTIPEVMSYLYDNGAWSIKSMTVKGFVLAIIWFLEAIIILGIAWLGGTEQAGEPFSEESNSWFEKKKLPFFIKQPQNPEDFLNALKNGNTSVLNSLEKDSHNSINYYQITSFAHPNEMMAYINVSNVTVKFDEKGKESKDVNEFLKNIRIPLSDLNNLENRLS